jgi:hypothetical protein
MKKKLEVKIFEDKNIRTIWNEDQEKWLISIIDVIEVLTNSERPRKYWSDLKAKLNKEGSQLSEKIGQLKIEAEDGKMRLTDVADTEQLFRLIQSIPSPKAEPFKLWLAKIAAERLDELQDPELTILILGMLAEASTKDISEAVNPEGFEQSKIVAKQGGNVDKVALKELESKTGKKVVSSTNAKSLLGKKSQKHIPEKKS